MGFHQQILDELDDVICVADEGERIVYINKAIEKYGMKKRKVEGGKIADVFPFLHEIGFFQGNKIARRKEIEIGGRKYYASIKVLPVEKFTILIIKDLTVEIKKWYEKILEMAHEGIYIEDEEGKIIFANTSFANMIGYKVYDIMGKKPEEFFRQKKVKKIENERYEIKATINGREKIFLHSSHKIYENDFMGKINFYLDVTEDIRRKEKMRILMERERNFRLKTAHYFFNPLAIAKGYMGLMIEEVNDFEREKVLKAIHAITRIENVIRNFVTKGEIAE